MRNYLLTLALCFTALTFLNSCGDDEGNGDDGQNTDVCATCKLLYVQSSTAQFNCLEQYCNLDFDFINSNVDFDSSFALLNSCGDGINFALLDTAYYVCDIID